MARGDSKEKINVRDFLLICISMFFSRTVMQMQSSTFALYLIEELGHQKAIAGLLGSTASLAAIFMRPLIGSLIDKGKAKASFIAGAILFTVSVFFSGVVASLPLLFLFRFAYGAGQAAQTTSGSSVATGLFPESRMKEGLGYFGLTSSLSQAIGAMVALSLVAAVGFRNQFFISTGIMFFSLLAGFIVRMPARAASEGKRHTDTLSGYNRWFDKVVERSSVVYALVMMLTEIGMCTIGSYLPIRAAELDIANIGVFFTVQAVSITGMRVLGARLTQGKLERPIFIASLAIVFFTLFSLFWATQLWQFILIAAVYGLASGNIYISMHTMIVMNAPAARRGMAHSTYYLSNDLGMTLGLTLWGVVADAFGTRTIYLAASLLPAAALLIFLLYQKNRNKTSDIETQ